jgi:ABC-type glycerol-3-phosphate transport system substrate-binding protein
MDKQNLGEQAPIQDGAIDRRRFLANTAKASVGMAGAGAALAKTSADDLAENDRMRSVNLRSKAVANLNFILPGSTTDQVNWNNFSKRFTAKNPNINVTVQVVSIVTWSDYFAKILTKVAGGKAPDIIGIATEGAQLFAAKDLAYPLDDLIKRDEAELGDFFSDINPKLISPFKIKGKTIALPYSWNNMVIFYNTKMFKSLGIAPPKANWTGDDFISAAKKLQASGPFGYALWPAGTFGIVCWMYAAGGALLDSTLTKSTATLPANAVAMQFLQDLRWKYKVAPAPDPNYVTLFQARRTGMMSAGRWPVAGYIAAKFTDYDVQYLPTLGPGRKNIFGVGANPIYKNAPHVEEAWTFLKYLATKEFQLANAALGASIPARRSVAYNANAMIPPHNFKIYYDSLNSTEAIPSPPQFNEMESALTAQYTKLMANELSPTAMLAALDAQLKTVLAQPV